MHYKEALGLVALLFTITIAVPTTDETIAARGPEKIPGPDSIYYYEDGDGGGYFPPGTVFYDSQPKRSRSPGIEVEDCNPQLGKRGELHEKRCPSDDKALVDRSPSPDTEVEDCNPQLGKRGELHEKRCPSNDEVPTAFVMRAERLKLGPPYEKVQEDSEDDKDIITRDTQKFCTFPIVEPCTWPITERSDLSDLLASIHGVEKRDDRLTFGNGDPFSTTCPYECPQCINPACSCYYQSCRRDLEVMATRAADMERCGAQDTYPDNSVCKEAQINNAVADWLVRRCASPDGGDSLGCRDGEFEDVVKAYVKRYDETSSCTKPGCPGFFGP